MAELQFKKNTIKDPKGIEYLRKAADKRGAEGAHFGALCLLTRIEKKSDQTELLRLEFSQMLRENIAKDTLIQKLTAELKATQQKLDELLPPNLVDPNEKEEPEVELRKSGEDSFKKRKTSKEASSISHAQSPHNVWTNHSNPYDPNNWPSHSREEDRKPKRSSSPILSLADSE